MGYNPTVWVDDSPPAITAAALNKIEVALDALSVETTTDNTLPRFDGTGGALQASGVTVDDSGNMTVGSTLNVSSAAVATASLNAGTGNTADLIFRSNGALRWLIRKTHIAESGGDVGSDLIIQRRGDAGAAADVITLERSTGKVTVGSPGAGFEYGASGPRDMTGTGSPEGVVTAPAGSTWRQTNHATLGYCKWVKLSGTGNTGWYPDFEGRWIAYTPTITTSSSPQPSGWTQDGYYTQTGKLIHARFKLTAPAANFGTGIYRIALPVTAASTYPSTTFIIGQAYIEDAGIAGYFGMPWITASATYAQIAYLGASSTLSNHFSHNLPFTFASTDSISGQVTYDAA